jgi:cellulose synthase/poly-beta-1,6-N-acetylglucosamine synthase-like glycosyltransferase
MATISSSGPARASDQPNSRVRPHKQAAALACLSVVVPVYNEAKTVGRLVKTVLANRFVREVLVVDDGSTDDTWDGASPCGRG